LPSDRESLFYFNVQEIPHVDSTDSSDGNVLNIALRTRIKLFYRPVQLKDNPVRRLKDLQWSINDLNGQPHLMVDNPTPFHVSFARIEMTGNGEHQAIKNPAMVEPLSRQTFALNPGKSSQGLQVVFSAINDYGGYTVPLTVPIQLAP
jgi:chaperone protein EcpD